MSPIRRIATLAAALPFLLAASNASAEGSPQGWQHTALIYGMGAAIDGTAQIGNVSVPVDVSISELFDTLEFGAMGAYRAENGTWSFTADATFMGLGGSDTTEGGRLKGDVDIDQLTLMATVGRRWTEHLEFLFGLGYFDLSAEVKVTSTAGEVVDLKAKRDADWIDPTIGLQYNRPFAGNWRLNLRGDIGGFGVGSDLMLHLLADVRWQASDTIGVVFGYRLIDFDYEDGNGQDYQHYDLTEQGPLVGVSISF
jgi:hypothetical protein